MAYEEIILDESILDLDSWLPQEAVDEIVQAILFQDKVTFEIPYIKNKEYETESQVKTFQLQSLAYEGYSGNSKKADYKIRAEVQAA